MRHSKQRILVVEDCDPLRRLICEVFSLVGHAVDSTREPGEAASRLLADAYALLVVDDSLAGMRGTKLVRTVRAQGNEIPAVLLLGPEGDRPGDLLKDLGKVTCLTKPFTPADLRGAIERVLGPAGTGDAAVLSLSVETLSTGEGFPRLETRNGGMKAVLGLVRRVAGGLSRVLLVGESGSGKELLARALHSHSPRRSRPFVAVNCAALTELLLESEIFGHAAGAFSGALGDKPGLAEAAHTGTLFLDEVSRMSPAMQAKLLRFLDLGEFRRVGEVEPRRVDIAVIAATNRDLERLCQEEAFARDLYFRLKAVRIAVPPLRERPEDILPLAKLFLKEQAVAFRREAPILSAAAREVLLQHPWSGNIRELSHCMHHFAATSEGGEVDGRALEAYLGPVPESRVEPSDPEERDRIVAILEKHEGSRKAVAEELGICTRTLRRRMLRLGMA